MAEDGDEVIGRDDFIWDELVEALQPRKGEMLLYAAKRCQAMAAKLPAAQRKAARYRKLYWEWFSKATDFKLDQEALLNRCKQITKDNVKLRNQICNWYRKFDKIAAALGVREGETLVAAAERVAQERGEWKKVKEYWERQVKKLEDAEAETARLKKALEDQAQATEQGRELVGPWIVERDEWRRRAESFERIANELQAELKKQESTTAAVGIKEYVSQFARFTGMSTATVEPHMEPPKEEKSWE